MKKVISAKERLDKMRLLTPQLISPRVLNISRTNNLIMREMKLPSLRSDVFSREPLSQVIEGIDKHLIGQNTPEENLGIKYILDKLKTCDGIVLGDGCHARNFQHDLLTRNLDDLYDGGVRKIYLEFIQHKYSWALKKFYETGDISDLARCLRDEVDYPQACLALVKKCKEKGIRCKELNLKDGSLIDRNKYWADHVKCTNKDNEKYILVGGSAHLSRNLGDNGIDKMLNGNIAVLETTVPYTEVRKIDAAYTPLTANYHILTYGNK